MDLERVIWVMPTLSVDPLFSSAASIVEVPEAGKTRVWEFLTTRVGALVSGQPLSKPYTSGQGSLLSTNSSLSGSSHTSPIPLLFLSSWFGLLFVGQLSRELMTLS